MSCGGPNATNRGTLSYDSAAYWSPTIFQTDGSTRIPPIRAHVYYFTSANCGGSGTCQAFPVGAQLVGGNSGAGSPSANANVVWSCGHETALDTPDTDHPYDYTPYLNAAKKVAGNSQTIVDGPIAKVGFPSCWNGTGTDIGSFQYQDANHHCPAGYTTPVPRIDFRIHLGAAWSGTMDPCSNTCNAWNIQTLAIDTSDTTAPFSGWITTAAYTLDSNGTYCTPANGTTCIDYTPQTLANGQTAIVRADSTPGWSSPGDDVIGGPFHVASVNNASHTFYVSNEIPGVNGQVPGNCTGTNPPGATGCGTIAGGGYAENFYLAGTTGTVNDHTHPYYTIHADFWNTWHQRVLAKLVADCLNNVHPCTSQNIDHKEQVDLMQ